MAENLAKLITKEAVLLAFDKLVENKESLNPSTKFLVEINGVLLPPKDVARYAAKEMGLNEADYTLNGGPPTNKYLEEMGFKIIPVRKQNLLQSWIEKYKLLIQNKIPRVEYNEKYKWETIQYFQDNWKDDHDENSILENLEKSFNQENNNLWSGSHFLPLKMMKEFAKATPIRVSEMFKMLFDESNSLDNRLQSFHSESEALLVETRPNENLMHYQDKRAMMLYLTLRYPQKYYLYKSTMYTEFCVLTGYRDKPKRKVKSDYSDIHDFIQMSTDVCEILKDDNELMEIYQAIIPKNFTVEDNYHLFTQDFIYAVSTYLKPNETKKYTIEEIKELFTEYLNRVIPKSARNYLSGISKVNEVAIQEETVLESIYEIQDNTTLKKAAELFNDNAEWLERNKVGNNMFSGALNHYGNFLKELNDKSGIKKDKKWYVLAKTIKRIDDEEATIKFFESVKLLLEENSLDENDDRTYAGALSSSDVLNLCFGNFYAISLEKRKGKSLLGFYTDPRDQEKLESTLNIVDFQVREEGTNKKGFWLYLNSKDFDLSNEQLITSWKSASKEMLNQKSPYRKKASFNPWIYRAAKDEKIRMSLLREDFSLETELSNVTSNDMKNTPLNQILFGPPGTGKTYNSINHAVSIIENVSIEKLELEPRNEILERYQAYQEKDQIVFTTFHQSMSYEDFVEGIKPDENDGQVIYGIEDGIFKSLCNKAKTIKSSESDFDWSNRAFYKMSLGGKSNPQIHSWCIEQNKIALGWGGSEDLSDFTKFDSWVKHRDAFNKKFPELKEQSTYNSQATRSFLRMKQGDIVVASVGNHIIDAIGYIDGPYEYDEANEFGFHHIRKVKWLATGLSTSPERFLRKKISQQTIYEFYTKDVIIEEFETLTAGEDKAPKPHVLIIDEINRGNVSAIFGELITLIEEDKRVGNREALELTLPYSKTKFGVPSNVHIIGTMNTADRSVEALDTALRRRFSFIEMAPKPELVESGKLLWHLWLKDWDYKWDDSKWIKHESDLLKLLGGSIQDKKAYRKLEDLPWSDGLFKNVFNGIVQFDGLDLSQLLQIINKRIEKLIDKDHMIGHSYFMSVGSIGALKSAFQNKIIPLLQEYFFGDYGKIGLVLGAGFLIKLDEKNGEDIFASFPDYDPESLLEKPVYHLKNAQSMSDEEFEEAIESLLGTK